MQGCAKMVSAALGVALTVNARTMVRDALILAMLGWLSLEALGLVSSLLNFYERVLDIKDGLVVSAAGFSPLTALMSRSEIEKKIIRIANITIDYYLVTPVLVEDKILLLKSSNSSATNCIFISELLARNLGARVGDHVIVSSVFTGKIFCLKICGYTDVSGYVAEASYDLVAQIRGAPPGYYSYAVIRGIEKALEEAAQALGATLGSSKLVNLAVIVLQRVDDGKARAALYNTLAEAYMVNFGMHRDFLLHFACAAVASSTLGAIMLGYDAVKSARRAFKVLRILGLSKRGLLALAVLMGLATVCAGDLLSVLIFTHVEAFALDIVGFVLKPVLPKDLAAGVLATLAMLYAVGLIVGVRREIE